MMEAVVNFVNSQWFPLVTGLLALWTIPWKGYALWVAAKSSHKWWFIAVLLINTAAILEIIYIFAVGRPAMRKAGLLKSPAPASSVQ